MPRTTKSEVEALAEAAEAAEAALKAARDREYADAWNELRNGKPGYKPPVPYVEPTVTTIDPVAALQLALRHLGGRPPVSTTGLLSDIAVVISWDAQTVARRLADLAADHRAQNLLVRASINSDRDTGIVLSGVLLSRITSSA